MGITYIEMENKPNILKGIDNKSLRKVKSFYSEKDILYLEDNNIRIHKNSEVT